MGISISGGNVSLPLAGTNARVDYDEATKTLRVHGISLHDRVVTHEINGVTDAVRVEFSVR